jgi:hypothetical protein
MGSIDATTSESGASSSNGSFGGTNGNGGDCNHGASGAGLYGDGCNAGWGGSNINGTAFVNGGQGGNSASAASNWGGFGGGSGSHGNCCIGSGGGGGYSGGGGASSCMAGGGGGSYNSGTSQDNESGVNEGHGMVVIYSNSIGCTYPEDFYDCDESCINDIDGDGVCDEEEISGCLDEGACNYVANITDEIPCIYNDECGVCGGSGTTCDDDCGVPNGDNSSCTGCMDETACNYDGTATIQSINYIADTLTTCGQEGRFGPTQEQINQAYGAESGITVVDGIQYWTVPQSGTYTIEAFGAQGGANASYTGGLGAKMQGVFQLGQGQVIQLLIGQMGRTSQQPGAGGGGGTFVVTSGNIPLLIAGAGSGAGCAVYCGNGQQGLIDTFGGDSYSNYQINNSGGVNGNGGNSNYEEGGAGGGFYSNGDEFSYGSTEGIAFLNGGYGGSDGCGYGGYGGFGGGGGGEWCMWGSPGAGGGYSGGGAASGGNAGGGGSFISEEATLISSESGVNEGHGMVVITMIP